MMLTGMLANMSQADQALVYACLLVLGGLAIYGSLLLIEWVADGRRK